MKRSEAWLRIYCAALTGTKDPTWAREEADDTLETWSRRFRKKRKAKARAAAPAGDKP